MTGAGKVTKLGVKLNSWVNSPPPLCLALSLSLSVIHAPLTNLSLYSPQCLPLTSLISPNIFFPLVPLSFTLVILLSHPVFGFLLSLPLSLFPPSLLFIPGVLPLLKNQLLLTEVLHSVVASNHDAAESDLLFILIFKSTAPTSSSHFPLQFHLFCFVLLFQFNILLCL